MCVIDVTAMQAGIEAVQACHHNISTLRTDADYLAEKLRACGEPMARVDAARAALATAADELLMLFGELT